MFSGLKEEKKDGKKDGDQMKITKEKLVEIIKEEMEDLDEASFGGLFGRGKGSTPTSKRRRGPSGADDIDVRAGEIDAMDSTAGLSRGGKKVYNAAVTDATADASKMDKTTSQKDFERVMTWANNNGIATEKEVANAVIDTLETGEGRMTAAIQEPLLNDADFIEELAKKIAQYRHTPGE
jgi:hypothetical protein